MTNFRILVLIFTTAVTIYWLEMTISCCIPEIGIYLLKIMYFHSSIITNWKGHWHDKQSFNSPFRGVTCFKEIWTDMCKKLHYCIIFFFKFRQIRIFFLSKNSTAINYPAVSHEFCLISWYVTDKICQILCMISA